MTTRSFRASIPLFNLLRSRIAGQSQFRSPSLSERRCLITMSLSNDIETFLACYPGQRDDTRSQPNVAFYRNEEKMQPGNMKYEDWMNKNGKDYEELEANHVGFRQSVNELKSRVVPYTPLDTIISDSFYGIDLNNGCLQPSSESKQRLRNLQHNPHNLLRITRILKHLSEITPLQLHAAPLVLYFTAQHSEGNINLSEGTYHGGSLDRWWSNVFRDESERKEVRRIVKARGGFGEGIWGMKDFGEWYETRGKGGRTT